MGTRPTTPEIELTNTNTQIINPSVPQQMQRDNDERLSCCQVITETRRTYQNDINYYGLCFCCRNTDIDRIDNQQVRDCREKTDSCILVPTCLPCMIIISVCDIIDYCCID